MYWADGLIVLRCTGDNFVSFHALLACSDVSTRDLFVLVVCHRLLSCGVPSTTVLRDYGHETHNQLHVYTCTLLLASCALTARNKTYGLQRIQIKEDSQRCLVYSMINWEEENMEVGISGLQIMWLTGFDELNEAAAFFQFS